MNLMMRIVMWGLLLCFPVGANAAEQQMPAGFEVGVGLICNSEQQVQRYLALHVNDQPPEAAINLVNAEANDPNACALAAIVFTRNKEGPAVPAPGGRMQIVEINVIAAQTPFGWQRVAGLVQYTAIFEKMDEA
jgi:hypothetical protein